MAFGIRSSADKRSVIVESGPSRAEFKLGRGPAVNELRRRPELLAAAFAYGYVPQANGQSDGKLSDYSFVVASAR